MNLPNALTVGRILITPLIAWLPLQESWVLRILAFLLFLVAAISDWIDGHLARSRDLVTNLGRLLDPLADKLLLLATFIPMYILMTSPDDRFAGLVANIPGAFTFPLVTPFGFVVLPWWVLAIVIGRELLMTVYRQAAAARGVIISAIGPAKLKTGFQWTWVGASFFWFFLETVVVVRGATDGPLEALVLFNGLLALTTMIVAVVLTVYTQLLYFRRFGWVFSGGRGTT